jgi:hypothetical protein
MNKRQLKEMIRNIFLSFEIPAKFLEAYYFSMSPHLLGRKRISVGWVKQSATQQHLSRHPCPSVAKKRIFFPDSLP